MDVVIPGIPPWENVVRNPSIWHFGFHAIHRLPEILVGGKELAYFDFFYEALARHGFPHQGGPKHDVAAIRIGHRHYYNVIDGHGLDLKALKVSKKCLLIRDLEIEMGNGGYA
jgi:hypothetical protein